jgi:Phospholipase_D-nuclease N-terminal
MRVLLLLAGLALTIYAVVDCIQTDDGRVNYLPKIAWVVLIVLVPWVGPIAWLVVGRQRSFPPGRWNPKRPVSGPRGPEDDPDFLRNL